MRAEAARRAGCGLEERVVGGKSGRVASAPVNLNETLLTV
jgi:hypothetical protein